MRDIQKSMKYSLILGLSGALILPMIYEFYANISNAFALILVACFVLISGIVFSSLSIKSALLGVTVSIAYNSILGLIAYVVIHPVAVRFLNSHSVYFQLSIKEQSEFVLYTALLLLCMYVVLLARKGLQKAYSMLKTNNEKTGSYINDAFSDKDDLK